MIASCYKCQAQVVRYLHDEGTEIAKGREASSNLSKISSSDFLRVDHQKEEISLGSVNTYQSIAFFRMMIPRYLGFS